MTRAVRCVLLLLAFLAGLSPSGVDTARGADVCALCRDAKSVACPTCGGKGVAANPCAACGGEGRGRCESRPRTTGTLPADWSEFFKLHKGTTQPCPNVCKKGRLEVGGATCKLCGGAGTTKCLICSETCSVCAGKRTVDGPCADCNGSGKLACLRCAPEAGPCPGCRGSKRTECAACAGAGHVLDYCAECAGRGRSPCILCSGATKMACIACLGTGKDVLGGIVSNKPAGKCAMCDGKGVNACKSCKQGWRECDACSGSKRLDATCRRCGGSKEIACLLCGSSSARTFELEGVAATRAGAKDAAVALLERADKDAASRAATADKTASAADDVLTEKINAIGSIDFDKGMKELKEAHDALFKYFAAAAVAQDARDMAKRIHAELDAAKSAPRTPPAGK